mgnify:CR=1 FL=1
MNHGNWKMPVAFTTFLILILNACTSNEGTLNADSNPISKQYAQIWLTQGDKSILFRHDSISNSIAKPSGLASGKSGYSYPVPGSRGLWCCPNRLIGLPFPPFTRPHAAAAYSERAFRSPSGHRAIVPQAHHGCFGFLVIRLHLQRPAGGRNRFQP